MLTKCSLCCRQIGACICVAGALYIAVEHIHALDPACVLAPAERDLGPAAHCAPSHRDNRTISFNNLAVSSASTTAASFAAMVNPPLKAFEVSDLDQPPEQDSLGAQGVIASPTPAVPKLSETPKFIVIDGTDPRRIG